jgi:hypothetical protein
MTEGAADFAGKLVLDGLVGGIVPLEVVVAVGEVDVLLVKDSGPLEGCSCGMLVSRRTIRIKTRTVLSLAGGAMAQLAV